MLFFYCDNVYSHCVYLRVTGMTGKGHKRTFWGTENAVYFNLVVVTRVYVKFHLAVYLSFMYFMLYVIFQEKSKKSI